MSRYLLTIKYDGTEFCGWQVQPNVISVQTTVQNALIDLFGKSDINVTGCSRTDSGVHANMFCLHFDVDTAISCDKIPFALNVRLPDTIRAYNCIIVPDDFHARYSCCGKTYVYKIHNSAILDPFKYKYYLNVDRFIDVDLLNAACKYFIGTHDFAAFCSAGSSVSDTVRTVKSCFTERIGEDVFFSITADGFLYNMVRIIVGTLLDVNFGKISVDSIPDIILSRRRDLAGPTARPHGLYLDKVFYDAEKYLSK